MMLQRRSIVLIRIPFGNFHLYLHYCQEVQLKPIFQFFQATLLLFIYARVDIASHSEYRASIPDLSYDFLSIREEDRSSDCEPQGEVEVAVLVAATVAPATQAVDFHNIS